MTVQLKVVHFKNSAHLKVYNTSGLSGLTFKVGGNFVITLPEGRDHRHGLLMWNKREGNNNSQMLG